jgi:acid phosphatase (class A)
MKLMRYSGEVTRHWLILAALQLLQIAGPAAAYEARYLAPAAVDLPALLPPPPAAGSRLAQQDLDAVLRAQKARPPATAAAARADMLVSVFRFSDVLGPGFREDRLPKTAALFDAARKDASEIGLRAKHFWKRPRPHRASRLVKPVIDGSTSDSYPSGHALYGCMTAVLLGVMVPEQRTELLARGDAYARNRVTGGAHYPTDVAAGCTGGKIVAAVLLQTPGFRADFTAARDEVRRGLGLQAAATDN